MHIGMELRNPASLSYPTSVPLKVRTYLPISGEAHTEAATISATVLPVELSTPHRWTKNGRHPSGRTSAEAKDAASTSLAAMDSSRRSLVAAAIQRSGFPWGFMAFHRGANAASPSN